MASIFLLFDLSSLKNVKIRRLHPKKSVSKSLENCKVWQILACKTPAWSSETVGSLR
jgi:hypothetical protein